MEQFGPKRSTPARTTCMVILALMGIVVAGCGKEAPPPPRPAPQVSVLTVTPKTIGFSPNFVAQTESSRQVNIVARVSGYLDKIAYEEGELIKQGSLMFQLDTKPFIAQLNAAQGELQSQQARLSTAEATYGRVKPLTEQDALPQADLDRAKGELDAARAAVFSAQAKVDGAQLNLGYATITSPVTGLASRALQRQGAFVNAMADSANLTYVAAIDPIWVNFSVSQNQMAKWQEEVKRGDLVRPANENYDVDIVLPGDIKYPYRGKISFADPSFSQDTGSFMVRAVLPNTGMELRPGMFVTAIVHGATRPNAIVVPQLAVQQGANGHLVYVVGTGDVVEIRPVIVGDYAGATDIVIVQGLHAGDRVVVDGVLKVVPGQPVKVAPTQAPAAPAATSTSGTKATPKP
ncbi:MAG: efflux RND transporter periplasmic adaptor subunit [Burkholderiales bacterium]|nr:efflux RND transporter periplasmic adaptor subunit [Burkholderiales bacterium]